MIVRARRNTTAISQSKYLLHPANAGNYWDGTNDGEAHRTLSGNQQRGPSQVMSALGVFALSTRMAYAGGRDAAADKVLVF